MIIQYQIVTTLQIVNCGRDPHYARAHCMVKTNYRVTTQLSIRGCVAKRVEKRS